ncbi:glycoside hydrolase [Aspergillus steynii IBT 23096]|uniref:Beta-xylanase n=1 Tax=Aspergillus steynii IBT 23096 TaxID=1392250 RepID=A0A2I2GSF3_9EURO|nr:glycoside hydrolase [Aspergillus steynii IBT 23096]PLB55814.1 glycoside hydrolase [Aspergillus steynii IBT 23096]
MKTNTLIALSALPSLGLALSTGPTKQPGLNSLMEKRGKLYFGTINEVNYLNDTKHTAILSNRNEFGQITPENSQKFAATEPQRGVFNFTNADRLVDRALARGQEVRCHNLVWYNGLPEWLTLGTWDRPTLLDIMENHIKHVVQHYRGRCYAWDVVNEAFNEDGSYRDTIWYKTIGPEYIPLAYELAAKYDPMAKLYYNDYGIEFVNNKSVASARLVQDLRAQGVKLDGVGLQGHLPAIQSPNYDDQMAGLKLFTDLGVEVAYTELDVFIQMPNNAAKTAQQAQAYVDTLRACLDTPKCAGITLWGFYDPYSWVWEGVPGFGDPCLWDARYNKKPVYDEMAKVLKQ